jgi:hypothetical protein
MALLIETGEMKKAEPLRPCLPEQIDHYFLLQFLLNRPHLYNNTALRIAEYPRVTRMNNMTGQEVDSGYIKRVHHRVVGAPLSGCAWLAVLR